MKTVPALAWVLLLCTAARATDLVEVKDSLSPQAANVVTRSAPRSLKIGELGLREAGLVASPYFPKGDEIRIFASADKMKESPPARIWINSAQTNRYWFHTGGLGAADDYVIAKGAAVVVLTKASTNAIAWKNPLAESKP